MVELKYTQLRKKCSKKHIGTKDSAKKAKKALIGQDKGLEALRLGLSIREKGFNVYISGGQGTGRTSAAKILTAELAKERKEPPDLCYVYNFAEPRSPNLLVLESGAGSKLRTDMEKFTDSLTEEVTREFSTKEFEKEKHDIVKIYQDKRDKLIRDITEEAKRLEYGIKMTDTSIYFMPIVDGEMISEETYNALPQEEKDVIIKRTDIIQEHAREVMRDIREFERETQKEITELENSRADVIIDRLISSLLSNYETCGAETKEAVSAFLEQVKADAMANLADFAAPDAEDDELRNYLPLMSLMGRGEKGESGGKYHVNLLTSHTGQGAPVIVDYNPTYTSLIGEIEYDNEHGSLTTDFMKIKPGLLHKANGGFLILQASDLLKNASMWEMLCKCLITGKLTIEPNREYGTGVPMAGLRPEACEIDVKVILVGPSFYYHILSEFDEDFCKLFKINAVFDYEMPYSAENIRQVASFVRNIGVRKGVNFTAEGIQYLIEHLSRAAERQNKLSTRLSIITDILTEAEAYALPEKTVTEIHIKQAVSAKENRAGLYEEKINEMIDENIIMLDTDGKKAGQINGLAVYESAGHVFAKPSRITATTYVGKSGIVNIEKEADMSGNIHDKGVQVIIGYLGQKYAQDFPLSLCCRVCFEQNYAHVDGDSASGAELAAILSSLADAPLRQDLAITGSINQRGEIQAIGGCTYKIEGFFNLCDKRGLTGAQGVIIPYVNINDLTLKDEVVEAVKAGKFHIYAIKHIDEAVELLTGIKAGSPTGGKYPPDTIHGMVYRKLKKFYRRSVGE